MQRRWIIKTVTAILGAAAAYKLGLGSETATAAAEGGMMGGGGMGDMMAPGNMMGPMRSGMELFRRHASMHRVVTNLPNGVHAVTTSTDPETATLLQEHVGEMYQRLDEKRAFPYPMSRAVPAMFANSTRYQRKLEALPDGIAVTETSDDPEMVAVIQAHARELNGFVREGMPAMMDGMMR